MISVIIPFYRAEACLPRCLDSWLAQAGPEYEVLCVGHTDDPTCAVAEAYARRFPRVRLIRRADGHSAGGNRNRGLDEARGELVVFGDADDSVEPVLLARLLDALTRHDADLACCGFDRRAPGRKNAASREATRALLWEQGRDDPRVLAFVYPAPWGKLWRKSRLAGLRFPDDEQSINEDCLFFLTAAPALRRVVLLPEVLYHYTLSPGSLMEQSRPDKSLRFQAALCAARAVLRRAETPAPYLGLLEYAAFIHVGIADLHRLAANPAVDADAAIRRARTFLDAEFPGWRHSPLRPGGRLTLRSAAVFGCALLHRMHCFLPCIHAYNLFSRLIGRIVKW